MLDRLSFKARLFLLMSVSLVLFVTAGVTGLLGVGSINKSLESVYSEHMIPITVLESVDTIINTNRTHLLLALQHEPNSPFLNLHDHPVSLHLNIIEKGLEDNVNAWQILDKINFPKNEQELYRQAHKETAKLREEAVRPAIKAISNGDYYLANEIILKKINPQIRVVHANTQALNKALLVHAQQEYLHSEQIGRAHV